MQGSETVTVIRKPARDNFGNIPAGTTSEWEVPGWLVAPGPSREMGIGGGQVESDATLYGPTTTVIAETVPGGIVPTDQIRVRGELHAVVGRVQDWGASGTVIILKRVTG
jgi:hypothetical protein